MTETGTPPGRIVLVGLSGSGKSAVARLVADRLGWTVLDSDDLIVAEDGRAIPRIFREEGEEGFRQREARAVARACAAERVVVATGGGAVLHPENRAALWRDAFVVHLDARTPSLLARLGGAAGRPLLEGNAAARLERLRAERGPLYALADWTLRTDGLTVEQVADEVAGAWERRGAALVARSGRLEEVLAATGERPAPAADPDLAAYVTTPGGSYAAYAGWNAVDRLPRWLGEADLGPVVHVVADRTVADLHGERLLAALAEGGLEPALHALELNESRKHLAAAAEVYDALVAARAERRHSLLAFGGGVATDLAGFVAATYLRGLPLVHVPTSLLGMVDAAIGGKVAVNHRAGKNLIGAFYQPRLVVADAALLVTLPRREYVSGWGEVIKHALILDPELLDWLERETDALLRLEPEPLTRVLRRSIALKARVVSTDEREEGPRMILNYGHTVGHALEAATGYETLLHGEAVAVGMAAAGHIARRMGLIDAGLVERQNALIARFGLPLRAPGVDVERVLAAMSLDKKVVGRTLRFILLDGPGSTVIRTDVPAELVREAVELVTGA
jgi:shikimate kinase/3-dehydroquinate synthase